MKKRVKFKNQCLRREGALGGVCLTDASTSMPTGGRKAESVATEATGFGNFVLVIGKG